MKAFLLRYGPRIIAASLLVSLGVLFGCGGSAGVQEGTVVGRVFSDASAISSNKSPIAGVTVVIRRGGYTPPVVRRTMSDANGNYVFTDVPVGDYKIGFSKEGFLPLDVNSGASPTRTNYVAQDIFMESAQTVVVPDVTLETNRQVGSGTIVITVLDGVTGDPVNNATVTAGVAVTSNGGNNGVYTLSVPLQPNDQSTAGTPSQDTPKQVSIQADGYVTQDQIPVGLVANETVQKTILLKPLDVTIDGVVRISRWQNLFNLSNVEIKITNTLGPSTASPAPNGLFTISGVPASNSNLTRTLTLRFTHPDLQTVVLSNIVAPRAGDRTVPMTVVMNPTTVTVVGDVLIPDVALPFVSTAKVVLEQTGQYATVVNGSYSIPDVPTRHATGSTAFNLNLALMVPMITVFNGTVVVDRNIQNTIQATKSIMPTSDGTANPIFYVSPIPVQIPIITQTSSTTP
jgi:hypothetical protein